MSTFTQFLPQTGIKTIQRGTITISAGNLTATATISSVTTGKTFLNWLGSTPTTVTDQYIRGMARLDLTNSTTVTATRGNSSDSGIVSYEVVEFN